MADLTNRSTTQNSSEGCPKNKCSVPCTNNQKVIQQILRDHKLCSKNTLQPETLKNLPAHVHEKLFALLTVQQQSKLLSSSSKKTSGKRPSFNKKYFLMISQFLRACFIEEKVPNSEESKSKSSSSKNSSVKIDSGHGNSNSKSSSLNSFSSDGHTSFSTDPMADSLMSSNKLDNITNDFQNIGDTLDILHVEDLVPTLGFAEITDEDTNNLATFDDICTLPEDLLEIPCSSKVEDNKEIKIETIQPTFGIKKPEIPSKNKGKFQPPAEPILPIQISKATDFYSNSGENSNQGFLLTDVSRSRNQSGHSESQVGQVLIPTNRTAQSSSGVSTASRISAVSNSTSITNVSIPSVVNNMNRLRRSSRTSSILAFPVVPTISNPNIVCPLNDEAQHVGTEN